MSGSLREKETDMPFENTSTNKIMAELTRGVAQITPPDGLAEKLLLAVREKRPLIVKLGFDPTAPDLHIGHAVVLRKMRAFQDLGHKVVIVIGDFTARIGDPTGRNKTRPPLSEAAVQANAATYLAQLSKILDQNPAKLCVRFNAQWLSKMTFADVVRLLGQTTLAQLLVREDFSKRYAAGTPIGMHEMLYPLMQGFDSVQLKADIEMGGTDQLFNCMMGRTLQEGMSQPQQVVMSMPLLIGLDGHEKMSKSHGNTIGLLDSPADMFGKVLSIPDALMPDYLDLATDFPADVCAQIKADLAEGTAHPMAVKKKIAHAVVRMYHDEAAADAAQLFFEKQFQNRAAESKIYEPVPRESVMQGQTEIALLDLCARLEPKLSRAQIKRLIEAGGVTLDGEKKQDVREKRAAPCRVRIGKRGYYAVS